MKLLVIDGNSLMNRAFYGIRLLSNKKGQYTNALYGFLNMYLSMKNEFQPDGTVVAFDLKAPTFRHKIYSDYKAGRKGMPDELRAQFPIIKEILKSIGCFVAEIEGYEADDILGTLSSSAGENDHCFIATGDRDSLQLVSDKATVLLASSKGHIIYDEAKIMEEYGVTPKQMIEIKALQGDNSDNIPGVAGIGPKTAMTLVAKYGNIDNIYEKIDEIEVSENIRNKLKNDKDSAYMSREIGSICLTVPIEKDYSKYTYSSSATKDDEEASRILTELELNKILERFGLEKSEKAVSKIEIKKIEYVETDIDEALKEIKSVDKAFVYFDFEKGDIANISYLYNDEVHFVSKMNLTFFNFVQSILTDKSLKLVVNDSKSVYRYALENGYECENIEADIMLGGYVLDPSLKSYDMIFLAEKFNIANGEADNESALKTYYLSVIFDYMNEKFKSDSQQELYEKIELPLAKVLASMEYEGFKVDKEGIKNYGLILEEEVDNLTKDIYDLAGYEFNINSPKQLGEALFEKLGLPCKKKTKTGYSTNADVLEELKYAHPVIEKILRYRTFAKLKSTYCDGLLKVICDDGKIRSTFNQTETRTGRLSSVEPNLQNIPVRTPEGKEFRKFFVAGDGNTLIDADYSQIELRVLANMADDKNMIEAFNDEKDFHTTTAAKVFNMPESMVTPLMRSRAKAVNFGIVYGIGAFSLAKDIGVTRKEADKYIKDYLELYSGVRDYMKNCIESAKDNGFAQTLMGRRRYLPELNDSSALVRKFGERVAMNMPVQGTAADIIKIAMIRVYERLKKENMRSKLIMQVHDELIVEAPEDEAQKAKEILVEEMQNAQKMKVKLVSDAGIGKTWYLAKD